ncbi:uncharacterized protein M6B38_364160 [Iris pallida]|uniref:Uncharacterized protein n=1 Tax=Iris pallida TaxID=29817 RepID=A0AAX6GIY5_IRIPA|nr:uncharacterized protein M6B38_364160 [Iris pallida]
MMRRDRGGFGMAGCNGGSSSSQEASLEKYGGIVPKKKPLISKDNGRAYFDSADWALGKQGSNMGDKTRAAVETLRPKFERTPHRQLPPRRPACTTGGENRA